jgi:TatD DNase family protein
MILDMGFYLGIGGVLTFKNSKLADTLAELNKSEITHHQPAIIHRLLLETDAPYMAPVPHRGERNESRWMEYVAERLAQVCECSKEELIAATGSNARLLFGTK